MDNIEYIIQAVHEAVKKARIDRKRWLKLVKLGLA